ncbi:MAG: biopolymer transporter ExbD [Pirellulaceae bacterium]|nr:biopolymer transporter ExbD [Pirellulaceae bacterium]
MALQKKSILRPRKPQEEAEMDITPMIDCTFLLLIFFLVASRIDAPLAIDLPAARHGTAVVIKDSVVLTVAKGSDGQVLIYKGDNPDRRYLVEGLNPVEQDEAIARYIEEQITAAPAKKYVLIKGEKGVLQRDMNRVEKAAGRANVEQLFVGVLEAK